MDLTDAFPENELRLARLTASKLAKVMHGLMSVGTASLGFDPPSEFLVGREKTPLGFLEVLACIGVNPGHADKIPLLREQIDQLAILVKRFHSLFIELTQWRKMPPQLICTTVESLNDCYSRFCQLLGDFCKILGMDADYSQQAQEDEDLLVAFFRDRLSIGAIHASIR
jgi:hypothetical protein